MARPRDDRRSAAALVEHADARLASRSATTHARALAVRLGCRRRGDYVVARALDRQADEAAAHWRMLGVLAEVGASAAALASSLRCLAAEQYAAIQAAALRARTWQRSWLGRCDPRGLSDTMSPRCAARRATCCWPSVAGRGCCWIGWRWRRSIRRRCPLEQLRVVAAHDDEA